MHKFLAQGALGPISGHAWSIPRDGAPGEWVQARGPLSNCANGVHVCRREDLAHWLHEELWELEVDGEEIAGVDCLVVRRARLVRRIEAWDAPGKRRFVDACIAHAFEQARSTGAEEVRDLLDDALLMASMTDGAPMAAYTTAVAVSRRGRPEGAEDAYRRERAWQSAWIARELLRSTL
jgi:hypothetical protein